MLDITNWNYKEKMILLGNNVRDSLSLKRGQPIYLYKDVKNEQLVLCIYELKRSLFHSIIIFDKIEDFIKFGDILSNNEINVLCNCFHIVGNKYRMFMEFEAKSLGKKSDCGGAEVKKFFKDVAMKNHIEVPKIFWYSDEDVEEVKNIFMPLITLAELDDSVLKKHRIDKNWKFYYNLKDFKLKSDSKNNGTLKCVQVANNEANIITMTFHDSSIKKISFQYKNFPGTLVRIINIFNELSIDIKAANTQIISNENGGMAETLYTLKFRDEKKINTLNLTHTQLKEELSNKIDEIDSKLAEDNISHKKIVESHKYSLDKLGLSSKKFIENIEVLEEKTKT